MDSQRDAGRVDWNLFPSAVLAGNPLGDPATRRLPVILPPGYDADSARRYPVVFGLAGFTGRGSMMLNDQAWQPNLQERLALLTAAGMPPVITVLPDCFTRYGGSQYLNSPATGRYEDYVTQEIVPWVDAHYRTIASVTTRGLFGHSSGGYGALVLGMRHPDLFGAVVCHAGDMAFDLCYRPDFPKAANTINRAGGLVPWFEAFESRVKKEHGDFDALNVVGMAACYSPNLDAPLGMDLPFDLYTCALRPDVWGRWQRWDPVNMLAQYAGALRSMRLLYLDAGTRDDFNLQYGARQFVAALQAHSVAHEYQEFDDGHSGTAYRYDVSLPRLAAALG